MAADSAQHTELGRALGADLGERPVKPGQTDQRGARSNTDAAVLSNAMNKRSQADHPIVPAAAAPS